MVEQQLKQLVNAPSVDDIALVKNTSEALSFVAQGINWQAGDEIITSDQEFPSNRIPWEALSSRGVNVRQISLQGDDPEQALIDAMNENTRLLTISSVQYTSGWAPPAAPEKYCFAWMLFKPSAPCPLMCKA